MQGGQSCCFQQAEAVMFCTCSFGQLLPQQGWTIQFWMLQSVPEIGSGIHLLPSFEMSVCRSVPSLSLYASPDLCWGASRSSRQLVCQPHFALSLWCFMACHWVFRAESSVPCHIHDSSTMRIQLFAPLHSPGWVQVPPHPPGLC
jgi:hypothetical protein